MTTQQNTQLRAQAEPSKVEVKLTQFFAQPQVRDMLAAAASNLVNPERVLSTAVNCIQKSPELQHCALDSLVAAIKTLVAMGCEPDGIHGYLVPFRDRKSGKVLCTPIPSARGLMRTARKSGIKGIYVGQATRGEVESGRFVWAVENGALCVTHRPDLLREDVSGAALYYVVWQDQGGAQQGVYMTRDEVERIRRKSKAGDNGPWKSDFDEMAKKTVLKRAAKQWDMPTAVLDAMRAADESEFEGALRDVTPVRQGGGGLRLAKEVVTNDAAEVATSGATSGHEQVEQVGAQVAAVKASSSEKMATEVATNDAAEVVTNGEGMTDGELVLEGSLEEGERALKWMEASLRGSGATWRKVYKVCEALGVRHPEVGCGRVELANFALAVRLDGDLQAALVESGIVFERN